MGHWSGNPISRNKPYFKWSVSWYLFVISIQIGFSVPRSCGAAFYGSLEGKPSKGKWSKINCRIRRNFISLWVRLEWVSGKLAGNFNEFMVEILWFKNWKTKFNSTSLLFSLNLERKNQLKLHEICLVSSSWRSKLLTQFDWDFWEIRNSDHQLPVCFKSPGIILIYPWSSTPSHPPKNPFWPLIRLTSSSSVFALTTPGHIISLI